MRILIVTQYFWPEEFRINDLAAGLAGRGHQVTVLTGLPNYPQGRLFPGHGWFRNGRQRYGDVTVLRVPLLPRGKAGRLRLALNYLSFASSATILGPILCRTPAEVIFVYEPSPVTVGIPAMFIARIKKAPVVFWVQDLWPESLSATGAVRSPAILKAVERLVRFIYGRCALVLAQSRAFFPSMQSLGLAPERLRYFPNSAEEFYTPVEMEPGAPERSEMPRGFRVLFAGNIGAAQDFGTILSAAAKLRDRPDIQWVILGDGRMRSWVDESVRELGLERTVRLLGRRPSETMPRYFALADVLLVTLRREPIFALTIPSKVQSYLACGRPIVAALDGEGARVVEESGGGVAVPAGNPEALAAAVLALYLRPEEELREMGARARRYFELHFEREMLLDRLDGWMREIASNSRGKAGESS